MNCILPNRRVPFFPAVCFFLGGVSAVLFCSGCDVIYRLLQKEGAEEREIIGEIVPFESNERVREVQKILDLFGYPVGNPDGLMGSRTRNALARFQKDEGLKVSRFIDRATWEKLHQFDARGWVHNGELNIAALQQALKDADFDPGPIDGKMGKRTLQAIQEFQKAMGLVPDGKVGLKTLKALSELFAEETYVSE